MKCLGLDHLEDKMELNKEDNWDDFPGLKNKKISWEPEKNGEFFYVAEIEEKKYSIRYNDFPDEPARTLFIDGEPIINFNDWPTNWINDEIK
jgi:hypothetical protein